MAKLRTSTGKNGQVVLKEYNHRCSICGADRPQIHHIDEDPSNQDPLNLLPLCPNCHLSDQHNPTAKLDPGLLRLFRRYKDPTILCSQFVPLFQRWLKLGSAGTLSMVELRSACSELVSFILSLQMGTFYGGQIGMALEFHQAPRVMLIPESAEDRAKRAHLEYEELCEFRNQVTEAMPKIEAWVVELLRYQSWRREPARDQGT